MANLAGQKTFVTIQQEIADEVLGTTTASASTDPSLTRIKAYANDAYRETVAEFPMWFKFKEFTPNTPSDGTTFTLAVDDTIVRIENIHIPSSQQPLRKISRDQFNVYQAGAQAITGAGIPIAWMDAPRASNNALQVDFYPTPDQAYTLSIWAEIRFSDLSDDTDEPVIPPEWQHVWINKAKMYAFLKLGDPKAEDFRALYEEGLEKMWLAYEQDLARVNSWRPTYNEDVNFNSPGLYRPYQDFS